jgi:hypothetical protein
MWHQEPEDPMTTWADGHQLELLEDPITARFTDFHHRNPGVYTAIVRLARIRLDAGWTTGSIGQIFEILRWEADLLIVTDDGLKLNNDFRAPYARLVMANEADLAGFFHTRALRSDWTAA